MYIRRLLFLSGSEERAEDCSGEEDDRLGLRVQRHDLKGLGHREEGASQRREGNVYQGSVDVVFHLGFLPM